MSGQEVATVAADCGHRDCAGEECPKCGTPPCCWHRDDCDYYRADTRTDHTHTEEERDG